MWFKHFAAALSTFLFLKVQLIERLGNVFFFLSVISSKVIGFIILQSIPI